MLRVIKVPALSDTKQRAAVLLNTEYDPRVISANETPITVRTTLIFLVILIGSYFQGL